MLVREIHHRVKNNLQMIVSLLSLQSKPHRRSARVLAAFEETEGVFVPSLTSMSSCTPLRTSPRSRSVAIWLHWPANCSPCMRRQTAGAQLQSDVQQTGHAYRKGRPGRTHRERIDPQQPQTWVALRRRRSKDHAAVERTGRISMGKSDGGRQRSRIAGRIRCFQARSMGYQLIKLLVRQLAGQLEIATRTRRTVPCRFRFSPDREGD